jgi:hypothetical protein
MLGAYIASDKFSESPEYMMNTLFEVLRNAKKLSKKSSGLVVNALVAFGRLADMDPHCAQTFVAKHLV